MLLAAHPPGVLAAGVERVVYASSSSVYGDSPELPKAEGREGKPLSPYALSKCMNEELAETFASCFGMRFVGLRYFNVYGPRQRPDGPYAAVIPRFFAAALEGSSPRIHGDGEQSRDFTFVADAVDANLHAAVAPKVESATEVNVARGTKTSVNELATQILALTRSTVEPVHEAPRTGDVKHSLADLTRAREALGWTPTTNLADGLAASLDYYTALFAVA